MPHSIDGDERRGSRRFVAVAMAFAGSVVLASCETPGTMPAPPGPPARASQEEIQAATRTVSRCMYGTAVASDNRVSAAGTIAKRVVGPCHPQFEAMLQVEEKGMDGLEAAAFDRAMRREELHIATIEVIVARDHLHRERPNIRAQHRHKHRQLGRATEPKGE